MKRIAILGSSGGNLYNLGGKEPLKLLGEIETQASSAGIKIAAIQFIGAKASMDNANESTLSRLYTWNSSEENIVFSEEKALKEVENIKKYHMEMMRVLSQTVAQVERIDKLNWKDRVKQYAIQMGITLGAILIILGAYQLINLIK